MFGGNGWFHDSRNEDFRPADTYGWQGVGCGLALLAFLIWALLLRG